MIPAYSDSHKCVFNKNTSDEDSDVIVTDHIVKVENEGSEGYITAKEDSSSDVEVIG